MKLDKGFTLIEVLIALAIIAIALTALIQATAQNVANTERIKDKSIGHWVAMQSVTAIQLGLIPIHPNQEITEVTTLLGQRWYWRALITPTAQHTVQQIKIRISKNQSGPFSDPLIAYRFMP